MEFKELNQPIPAAKSRPTFSASGVAAIVFTVVGWSSIPLFLKHLSSHMDFWTANGWRYGFSAMMWAPVLVVGVLRKSLPQGLWRKALLPGIFSIVAQLLFGWAPYLISPGLMTFALRVHIIFVAVGAAMMFANERRTIRSPWFVLGLLMVLGGTAGATYFNPQGLGTGTLLGVVVSMGAGLFYACYALSVRKYMQGIGPFVAFAAVSMITAIGLVGCMVAFGEESGMVFIKLPPGIIAVTLLSSIIGIGLGHTFYFYSISRIGVAAASGVTQLQPFFVSLASIPLFGEHLTPAQWAFGFTAVAGAVVILLAQRSTAKSAAHAGSID